MLPSHNNEVTKPRALNTFLDGLAELGVDKGLIKNKKLLSDLIEKEKGQRNSENTSDNEEEEEGASENGVQVDFQESYNDTENDHSQETESSSLETPTTFHSENPCEHRENSKVYGTLIMKGPKCFWHDYYKICPICDHQILEERNYIKEGFHECGAITHN